MRQLSEDEPVTRSNQEQEVIYVDLEEEGQQCFVVAPDGVGRYWYDSIEEARAQHGDLSIVCAFISMSDF